MASGRGRLRRGGLHLIVCSTTTETKQNRFQFAGGAGGAITRYRRQTVAVDRELSPSDWAVLGVVAERPTHGFAVAQILGRDGAVGRVWSVPRPVVYQLIKKLESLKLIAGGKTEPGDRGPQRTVYRVTPAGRRALGRWLSEPVEHVRDVRSLLMLKLALLDRAGADPGQLVHAQRVRAEEQLAALVGAIEQASGFDRVILQWRLAATRATLDFLVQLVTT